MIIFHTFRTELPSKNKNKKRRRRKHKIREEGGVRETGKAGGIEGEGWRDRGRKRETEGEAGSRGSLPIRTQTIRSGPHPDDLLSLYHLLTGLSPTTVMLRVKISTYEFGQGHSSVVGLPWARFPLSAPPSFTSSMKRHGDD